MVLLIAVLALGVVAVRERHSVAVASSLQRGLKPTMYILNKIFDSNIALLASFVTAVDYSSSYEPTGLSFFVFFVH